MRFLAIFLLAGMLHAAPASMSFKWNELSGAIGFKEVIVDLKDGSRVKGEVGSVEPSALEIYVSKKDPSRSLGILSRAYDWSIEVRRDATWVSLMES
jgi:hypothetical protein